MLELGQRFVKEVFRSFVHLLYPPLCLHCSECLDVGSPLFCRPCLALLEVIDSKLRCPYCFTSEINPETDICCLECRQSPQVIHRLASAFDYEGPAATLIKQMKYGNKPYLAEGAGAFLTAQFLRLEWPMPDCIIPMPMARLKKFERGYNQSELLANVLGRLIDRPVLNLLKRRSGDFSQAALSYDLRLNLPKEAFCLKEGGKIRDKTVLLIDDVMTTGQTIRCSAEALLSDYPAVIYALTLCRSF